MTPCDPLSLLEQDELYQLILLGGLPGSGKTFYLEALVERGWNSIDDFQSKAPNDSIEFRDSRRFTDLRSGLQGGNRCVVADIRIIHRPYRESALRALGSEVGPVDLQFQIFENRPALCSRNVKRDRHRPTGERLDAISHWTHHHSVPGDAVLLRVWRDEPSLVPVL